MGSRFINLVALREIITLLHIMLVVTGTSQRATFKNYLAGKLIYFDRL